MEFAWSISVPVAPSCRLINTIQRRQIPVDNVKINIHAGFNQLGSDSEPGFACLYSFDPCQAFFGGYMAGEKDYFFPDSIGKQMIKVLRGFDGIKNKEIGFIGLDYQFAGKIFDNDRFKIDQDLQTV